MLLTIVRVLICSSLGTRCEAPFAEMSPAELQTGVLHPIATTHGTDVVVACLTSRRNHPLSRAVGSQAEMLLTRSRAADLGSITFCARAKMKAAICAALTPDVLALAQQTGMLPTSHLATCSQMSVLRIR